VIARPRDDDVRGVVFDGTEAIVMPPVPAVVGRTAPAGSPSAASRAANAETRDRRDQRELALVGASGSGGRGLPNRTQICRTS